MLKYRDLRSRLDEMKKIPGTQFGSNPGGVHIDDEGGKHYAKFYRNPDQGHAEIAASKVYELLGAATTKPEVTEIEGKHSITSKWNDNLLRMHPVEFDKHSKVGDEHLAPHFVAAVLTKNWDAVGLDHDNIMKDKTTGKLHCVDCGGSFHFRAQGEPKPYTPDADEIHSFKNNPGAAGQVFRGLFTRNDEHEILKPTLQKLKDTPDDHFREAVKSSGLSNHQEISDTLLQRKAAILKHYNFS